MIRQWNAPKQTGLFEAYPGVLSRIRPETEEDSEKFYDNFVKDSRYVYLLKGLGNTLVDYSACIVSRGCIWISDRNRPYQS